MPAGLGSDESPLLGCKHCLLVSSHEPSILRTQLLSVLSILQISLTRLRDAQVAGKMLFLGVSVRVFWKKLTFESVD